LGVWNLAMPKLHKSRFSEMFVGFPTDDLLMLFPGQKVKDHYYVTR
jgi:hypothetical protein